MGLFGLFKKEVPKDRYAGKPLLKLIDSFILKTIGQLDPAQEKLLEQMVPKLQQTFGMTGTWEEIVLSQLNLSPDVRASIQALWERNQTIAKQNGVVLTPLQFTEMFVEKNIPLD